LLSDSSGLTYVCFITGFTCQPVYAAFVVVLCDVKVFRSGLLVCCISTFKCYVDIRKLEKACDFFDLGTVISEGNPFFALVVEFVSLGSVLRFLFQFSVTGRGNLLLLAMVAYRYLINRMLSLPLTPENKKNRMAENLHHYFTPKNKP
jgi:hypothetical protein